MASANQDQLVSPGLEFFEEHVLWFIVVFLVERVSFLGAASNDRFVFFNEDVDDLSEGAVKFLECALHEVRVTDI